MGDLRAAPAKAPPRLTSRVVYLGPPSPLVDHIAANGMDVDRTEDPVRAADLVSIGIQTGDIGISYGYRHIVPADVLDQLQVFNLHISLLPWNRGADPNLWSWIDNTPKGVTIHRMDAGLDTGRIVCQQTVGLDPGGTLSSTYRQLTEAVEALFVASWPDLLWAPTTAQAGGGTEHRVSDRPGWVLDLLDRYGWDLPVRLLESADAP